MIAGGTIGDAMWISSIEGFYRMAATGTFIPMDDLISGANYDLSQFYDVAIEAAKHKGQIYGLPWCTHPGRVGLHYYKPTFDAAGVDYPTYEWTHDDLLDAATAISKPDENVFGFLPGKDYFSLLVYQRAWGGDMINEDGTKCPIDSSESVAALQFVSDLFHVHNVSPQPAQMEVGTYQMFAAEKLAMYQSGFWGGSVREYVDRGTWGTVPMPYGPAGVRGSMYEFDPVCITYTSEHPKETFDYLTYLCTYKAGMDMYQVRVTAPGARPDVWRSDEMLADPHFTVFSTVMDEILPLVLPANFRETEYFKTIGEMISEVWIGEKELAEVIDDVQSEAQAILDKPSLEA
jgi:multiple sugar transport system substrate-binding protein